MSQRGKGIDAGWEWQVGRNGLEWNAKGKVDPNVAELESSTAHPLFKARSAKKRQAQCELCLSKDLRISSSDL